MNSALKISKNRSFFKKNHIPEIMHLTLQQKLDLKAASWIIPFKTNKYIINELIEWSNIPQDPMYQLTLNYPELLDEIDLHHIQKMQSASLLPKELQSQGEKILQKILAPYFASLVESTVSQKRNIILGLIHHFPHTVLLFPISAQDCFAYCTYCIRWMNRINSNAKFYYTDPQSPIDYIKNDRSITDILLTGGDVLCMETEKLEMYIRPLLEIPTIHTIRLATKAISFWPYRFVSEDDADELLRLFEHIRAKGKHLTVMAHISHPRELSTAVAEKAIRRIISTGAVIRCQCPLARHVNDSSETLSVLFQREVELGMVPYYLFLESSITLKNYFKVPYSSALTIFNETQAKVGGLAKTVRGPVLNHQSGKILIDGVVDINGKKIFVFKYIEAIDSRLINRLFFAEYDSGVYAFDQLKPAFGKDQFIFQ